MTVEFPKLPKDAVLREDLLLDLAEDLYVSRQMMEYLPEGNDLYEFHRNRIIVLEDLFRRLNKKNEPEHH